MPHVSEVMTFVGPTPPKFRSDGAACTGMNRRSGIGKVRHLETRVLWLQELIKLQKLEIAKRTTDESISGLGTEALDERWHNTLVKMSGVRNLNEDEGEATVVALSTGGAYAGGGHDTAAFAALGLLLQARRAKSS